MADAQLDDLLAACEAAVRGGGAVLAERWAGPRTVALKGAIDLVTDADRASEAAVLAILRARFPRAAILAEESGASGGGGAPLRFLVDPLDGTTNYAHRLPHYAVTVAALDAGGVAAGATFDPVRGERFLAARGRGATCNGVALAHSGRAGVEESLLVTGFPYDVQTRAAEPLRLFEAMVTRARGVRRLGAAALDLAWVAAGRFDGYWEARLKPWDLAAGILIAREAGAVVTDLEGGDRMLESGDVLAAAPALHPRLAGIVAAARGGPPAAGR